MTNLVIPVELYMNSPVHAVRTTDDLEVARKLLREFAVSSLAVVDGEGRLAGVVSRTDLLHVGRMQAGARPGAALLTLPHKPVGDIMTRKVISVGPADPLARAAQLMAENHVHRVFVTAEGIAVGVLSTRDIMTAIREKRVKSPISRYMSSPVFTVRADEPISLATERLEKAKISGLVVLDEGYPVGVFTQEEALRVRHLPREVPVEEAMGYALLCLDADTPLYRAAGQACELGARRVVAMKGPQMVGILTGIDLAQAVA